MKKHKKIIGVVLLLLIMVTVVVFKFTTNTWAVTTKPTSCENTKNNLASLSQWYGIEANISEDAKSVTLSCKHGEFKITDINDPRGNIGNTLTKVNGYVLVDGKESVIGGKNGSKVKLKIKSSTNLDNDLTKISFELTDGDGVCDSYKEYKEKEKNNEKRATYEAGALELSIPNSSVINAVVLQDNKNYNGVCKAIRTGTDTGDKVGAATMKLYDSSAAAIAYYKKIVGSCWEAKSSFNYDENTMITMIRSAITTWNFQKTAGGSANEKDSVWSINFENVKAKAPANHRFYVSGSEFFELNNRSKRVDKNDTNLFRQTCNYKAKSNTDFSNLDLYKKDSSGNYLLDSNGKKVYNIDANIDYYYAMSEVSGKANYTWTYTSKESKTESVDVCNRICEEAVEVKYGPPVASKAGLCFEYQIQVTSRVKCTTKITANPPTEPGVCNPIPYCNNIPGYIHQGGSNAEFDACINSCDGGKYTKKCSDKCYSKVYGKKSKVSKTNVDFDSDIAAKKISFPGCSGNYTYSNGTIGWDSNTYGRYYCDFEYNRTVSDHGAYTNSGGFKKHINRNGLCNDPCHWTGCKSNQYLNKSEAQRDYSKNVAAYNKAVQKCAAGATCTTKTANFKISVNYTDASKNEQTIEFPYTTKKDTLQSSDKDTQCTSNPDLSKSDGNHILLNYGGCYESCGTGFQYHARWSFPGTWVNNKTGEISYKPIINSNAWTKQENKFCIPLDAQNVNANWWNYYYHHVNTTTKTPTSVDSDEFKDKCLTNSNGSNVTNTTDPGTVKKWNINGSTTNFGYFGWNFTFRCFYALNSNPATINTNSTSKEVAEKCITDDPETDYRIRSVDLTNLFPKTNGSQLETTDVVGRQPGFNWTVYANNAKNPAYLSVPLAYTTEVQKLGYNVYNNDSLDYEFNLTPALMKKMRDQGKNYGEFKGSSKKAKSGIISYSSNLFRGSGILTGNSKVPNESVVGCNNIANYSATGCKQG